MSERFAARGPLRGELRVPADKSISHRAALFGAMADGVTRVEGYLDSADTRSTLAAVAGLGAEPRADGGALDPADPRPLPPLLSIRGVGLRGARPATIDVGNAGTLIRLISGWLAGQPAGEWLLDGDDSIRGRPMARIVEPLTRMGARIESRPGGLAPLRVEGAPLKGIAYDSPVASAQVKSCLLLAGLLADGPTTVIEPEPSRDHTERMLAAAGARVERQGTSVTIHPARALEPLSLTVPGDISSAAFFIVAALLVPGSDITLRGVGVNPTRTGILDVLDRMGARIERLNVRESGGEPVADLRVRAASGALRAAEVAGAEIPRAIDELPLIALAACFAAGKTMIRDAAELRRKESDRIETTVAALRAVGAEIEGTDDGLVISGPGPDGARSAPADRGMDGPRRAERAAADPPALRGGEIDSHGDHRIAMLGAIAGLVSRRGVTVRNMEAAAVSYPTFAADLASLAGIRNS